MLRIRKIITLFYFIISLTLIMPQSSTSSASSDTKSKADSGASSEGALGTVSIDGQIYNQIAFRPTIPIGKFAIALDIYMYFNDAGIYTEAWKFEDLGSTYRTIIDKIYFVRYGKWTDNFYIRAGALQQSTLGQGILINNYSNVQQYPEIRRLGVEGKVRFKGIGIEAIVGDTKTIPSVLGARLSYKPKKWIEGGVSFAMDLDQKKGLLDSDGDGYPDPYDFYPNNADKVDDTQEYLTDYNSIVESLDLVPTNDGFNDWWETHPDRNTYDSENVGTDSFKALAVDIIFPLTKNFKIYSQAANYLDDNFFDGSGYGFVPVGASARLGPFNFRSELRMCGENFLFNFWDQAYDLERAIVVNNETITKSSTLDQYQSMKGFFAELTANLFDMVFVNAGYQWLFPNDDSESTNSLLGEIKVETRKIPKLNTARAYYSRTNDPKPYDFSNPSTSTLWGYELSLEASEKVDLLYNARTTYVADPSDPTIITPVESMQIETKIKF